MILSQVARVIAETIANRLIGQGDRIASAAGDIVVTASADGPVVRVGDAVYDLTIVACLRGSK